MAFCNLRTSLIMPEMSQIGEDSIFAHPHPSSPNDVPPYCSDAWNLQRVACVKSPKSSHVGWMITYCVYQTRRRIDGLAGNLHAKQMSLMRRKDPKLSVINRLYISDLPFKASPPLGRAGLLAIAINMSKKCFFPFLGLCHRYRWSRAILQCKDLKIVFPFEFFVYPPTTFLVVISDVYR